MQKLYCYVDESGQDDRSPYFVVVVVVSYSNQQTVREELELLERISGTGHKKWHKVRQKIELISLSV